MKQNRIRLSLIIPAYNEEQSLAACLDSIAAQYEPLHEVIVVNNGSTDATADIARRYPFVRLLNEPKRGRIFAQIHGFTHATGDVLGRIDADAVLPKNWSQQVSMYFSEPSAMETAWTGGAFFYNVRFPRFVSWLYDFLIFHFNRVLAGHPTLWGSNMAIPVGLWQDVVGDICQRNDIHEDLDLAIHLHRHGRHITFDTKVRTHVQLRRVRSNRKDLWEYLQMWPRTLRIHGIWTWPICWFFGAFLLYLFTPLFSITEWVARRFGKRPLED